MAKAFNVFLVVLMAAASWIGCAATRQLSPLETTEKEYQEALLFQRQKTGELSAASTVVEKKKPVLVTAYRDEAKTLENMSGDLQRQAVAHLKRAEELDPPAKKLVEKGPVSHLDIQVASFTLPGVKMLTDCPSEWVLKIDGDARKMTLEVKGKKIFTFEQPEDFSPPVCYRLDPQANPEVQFCPYELNPDAEMDDSSADEEKKD